MSRPTQDSPNLPYSYLYGIITLYDVPFQKLPIFYGSYLEVLLPRICRNKSGLGYFLFARHYLGNRFFFLFLRVMRCFSSPGSPDSTIDSYYRNTTLLVLSSLIRISADLRSFATPHSFSQLVTSFFGAMYQGILLYALCSLIFS